MHLLRTILLLAACGLTLHAAPSRPPNVVVLLVDDLGWGDVSCLNAGEVRTPHIDRIAQSGVKFTSGYVTTPLCGPSRAGFLSGVYPQRFGFVDNSGGIPTTQPLLPGVLRQAGYRTALIGKWHSTGPMPHERGIFDETLCSPVSSPFIDFHHPKLARNGVVEEHHEYSTDLFTREAVAFITRNQARPFALTVTFNAPHILRVVKNAQIIRREYDEALAAGRTLDIPKVPMARPGEAAHYASQFPGDTARADTVATIAALDEGVGRILDALQAAGIDRNTIVLFFGDNGGHPENRSESRPLRDYKWSLYEGGIRVPFLASYPGTFPAGRTFSHPVSTLDLFATCVALTGAKPPPRLDGVNLTPFLTGEISTPPHDALYFSISGIGAVRQGVWKLLLPPGASPQLYDLSADLGEKNDLAAAQPERVQALKAKWQAWHAQMPVPTPPQKKKQQP
ncbi:sulfatase family protein [Horticoccus sp. 23ND18S-11]|uniref:sulfatase family protein n=1 Tax=Horticoccus sp. 23ND18S-11 TaxID=3391832 RepID=UPI0039C979C4